MSTPRETYRVVLARAADQGWWLSEQTWGERGWEVVPGSLTQLAMWSDAVGAAIIAVQARLGASGGEWRIVVRPSDPKGQSQ